TRTAGFHNLRVYQSLKRLSKHEGFLGLYNSLLVNRLSGKIPKHVGNITTLTYLMLEANNFSGVVPPELGKLINLQTLILSSNQLTGTYHGTLNFPHHT
ncbi:hypothetical protein HN873_057402, partial [Arachis hypogaea]